MPEQVDLPDSKEHEMLYEKAYKAIIERRLSELEKRLEYLEQSLDIRKRD